MLPVPRDWSERGLLRVRRRDTPAVGQFRMADRRWIYCFCRGNPRSTKAWKNCTMTRHDPKELRPPFLSSRMMHRFAEKLADVATSSPVDLSSQSRATESASTEWIRLQNEELIQLHTEEFVHHGEESRWSNSRLEYVPLADAGTSILSILDITTQRNNSIVNINDWDTAQTRGPSEFIGIRILSISLPQPTPESFLSFARSICYVFLSARGR